MNEMFHWIILFWLLLLRVVAAVGCATTHGRFSLIPNIEGVIWMNRSFRVLQ
jgi:hypothetical protein